MKTITETEPAWGEFCNVFGVCPRNQILEFFLEARSMDFSIGDVAIETKLNRATTYNEFNNLIKEGYIIPTRKVSGAQLYTLDLKKTEVKILIQAFDKVLKKIMDEELKKS